MSRGNVLVTGASGYIAGFVVKQLLDEGWTVRGTIRNLAKADQVHAALGTTPETLQLFAADLESDAGWAEATEGCDYIQHVASPFPNATPKHEDELIVPAREGALRALRFASAAGVKRVVMTSSMAAIAYGGDARGKVFTEKDWTDPASKNTTPYVRSKTIAERAAREFVAADASGLELVTMNPGAVLGPVMSKDYSTSIALVERLLAGNVPGIPKIGFAIIDVRDVADAHVKAMTKPGIDGDRFLLTEEFLWMAQIAGILKAELGEKARKVPTRGLPDFAVRLFALFDKEVASVTNELSRPRHCDNSHTREVLGWSPRPARESIVDTANSLIEVGAVEV